MIEWISSWAEQIIVAVIITTIIEMILPNGNSKKYIKTVLGIYILFTILSPIINKFVGINMNDIDYEKYFKTEGTYQAMSESLTTQNNKTVEDIYIINVKQDVKNKLNKKGYKVENITIKLNFEDEEKYGELNGIIIDCYYNEQDTENDVTNNSININKIEKITIGNTVENTVSDGIKQELTNKQVNEIKEYLSNEYNIKRNNIVINNK